MRDLMKQFGWDEPEYVEWLKGLKAGDEVCFLTINKRVASKVEGVTQTGMIRLENGELFTSTGRGRGIYRYSYLQPYTEEHRLDDLRKKASNRLSTVDWAEFDNEDLLKVMEIVSKYES